ncbi:MAG: hypothetical protein WCK90_03725 [archaeon]
MAKMARRNMTYAQLNLYAGIISNDGVSEGRFNSEVQDLESQKRYFEAMKVVNRAIDSFHNGNEFDKFSNRIEYCVYPLVENESQAKTMIDILSQHYPNGKPVISLIDSMHGHLRFYRQIEFEGMTEADKPLLVERVNSTGMGPMRYGNNPNEKGMEDFSWKYSLFFFPKS